MYTYHTYGGVAIPIYTTPVEVGEEGEYIYISLHCHHQNDLH